MRVVRWAVIAVGLFACSSNEATEPRVIWRVPLKYQEVGLEHLVANVTAGGFKRCQHDSDVIEIVVEGAPAESQYAEPLRVTCAELRED